ncbi:MAG TPA: SAM-dependent methyltransferase [Stellaceae bacterium]|nr:SAM-dependent methyltransferase [Stellaceae bacterium]
MLDLAAGSGRHVRLLRDAGYQVLAADRDTSALRAAFSGDPGCDIREMDLEDGGPWRLGGGFHGILVANYLWRPLLPSLAAALAPGGALLYETFMRGQERFGRPTDPNFLLRPGELLAAFMAPLAIIAFEQGEVATPRPAMVQRLAAVKGAPGRLPSAENSTSIAPVGSV